MSSSQIYIKYNINENEYNKELQEIMKNLNVYNSEISEMFKKSKKAKTKAKAKGSVGNIIIKYGKEQNAPLLNFKGCKVMKKEYIDSNDDNIFVIALLILDNNNEPLLTKELKILKTIDIDDIKSKFLEKINGTSLIIKIKDFLSKINDLNDITNIGSADFEQKFNKLDKSEIDDLKIQYKEQYNILKQEYTNLVSGLYAYDKVGKKLLDDYNIEYNLLRHLETYIEQELNNNIDEDYIKFQNENNTPQKKDMLSNRRKESDNKINSYNYFQKKKNLQNYYDNTEFILDTKKYEVVITKHKEYKNEMTCSEPTKLEKKEYKQEIILKNVGKYDKNFMKEEELYNKDEDNIEILLISNDMKASEPGLIPPEIINESSLEENKFQILKTYSDWRKKLCADYIFEIMDSRGTYILPILIDNNYFASFSHFYYFSKFKNRSDKEGPLKEQYNRFADSLVLSGLNSRRFGEKNGYKSLEEIQSKITSFGFTYNDTEDETYIVIKGLFAKFYQNDELQDILKNTLDSMLIINTNDKNTYKIDYNLMIVRYLLNNLENNKDNILKFYPNYDSDAVKFNKLKLKCEKERESDNNKLFYSSPFSRIKFDSYSIYENETSNTVTPDEIENKSTSVDKTTSINKPRDIPTTSLNKPISKPIDGDKSTDINESNSLNENLTLLETLLESQGLEVVHQPDTGDCLFFSLNEGIIKNKIPNYENLQGDLKFYIIDPRKTEEKKFRYNFQELKTEIINKLKANFYQNGDSGEQRTIFKDGEEELEVLIGSTIGEKDYKSMDKYFKKFSKDRFWGDQNVINGVSALYNINIIVYSIFGEPTETLAIDSRKQLPYGEKKNSEDKNLPALMLGFIPEPGHWVLLKKKGEPQKGGNNNLEDLEDKLWEKRKYFIIEIENDNKLYNIASLVTKNFDKDIRIEPEALYNSENGLLIYNDSPLWDKLVDKTNNYFLKNNKNYKKNSDILVKYYFINAINNDVHDPKDNMKNIGKLKLTKENGNSLSKIVYNN